MPLPLRALYDWLHDLSGPLKLAIALAAPVVVIVLLDWWARFTLGRSRGAR